LTQRRAAKLDLVSSLYRDCLTANELHTPAEVIDRICHDEYLSFGPQNKSKATLAAHIQQLWRVVPDLRWEVQQILVEGDKVVVRSLASGSPRGDFMGLVGLDGSKSFHITTIDIHSIEGGRIRSTHHLEDWDLAVDQLRDRSSLPSSQLIPHRSFLSFCPPLTILRDALQDAIYPLYRDCLTANELHTPAEVIDRICHDEYLSFGPQNKSKATLAAHIQQLWRVVPDLRWEVQQILVEGDKVVVRSLASGSPRGDFMGLVGLDGSKSFHITTIDIHSIEGGRIRSTHHLEDWGTAIRQLRT
jgi:predicted ester cyclase